MIFNGDWAFRTGGDCGGARRRAPAPAFGLRCLAAVLASLCAVWANAVPRFEVSSVPVVYDAAGVPAGQEGDAAPRYCPAATRCPRSARPAVVVAVVREAEDEAVRHSGRMAVSVSLAAGARLAEDVTFPDIGLAIEEPTPPGTRPRLRVQGIRGGNAGDSFVIVELEVDDLVARTDSDVAGSVAVTLALPRIAGVAGLAVPGHEVVATVIAGGGAVDAGSASVVLLTSRRALDIAFEPDRQSILVDESDRTRVDAAELADQEAGDPQRIDLGVLRVTTETGLRSWDGTTWLRGEEDEEDDEDEEEARPWEGVYVRFGGTAGLPGVGDVVYADRNDDGEADEDETLPNDGEALMLLPGEIDTCVSEAAVTRCPVPVRYRPGHVDAFAFAATLTVTAEARYEPPAPNRAVARTTTFVYEPVGDPLRAYGIPVGERMRERASLRIRCETSPCRAFLECATDDGTRFFGQLDDEIGAGATETLSGPALQDVLGADDVEGHLSCYLYSVESVTVQAFVGPADASAAANITYVATGSRLLAYGLPTGQDEHGDVGRLRVRCEVGGPCTARLACRTDTGEPLGGILHPPIPTGATRMLNGNEIDIALGHRPGTLRGRLSCALTGTGRLAMQALVRNAMTGRWTNMTYVAGP